MDFGMSMGELEKSRCRTAWMSPIPDNTSKAQIIEWFRDYGAIDCTIQEKDNNRFAFVAFATEQERDMAIQAKKNTTFRGVTVVVNRSFNAFRGPRLGGRTRYDDDFGMEINY
jgi:RNA recognition motif-containing protein